MTIEATIILVIIAALAVLAPIGIVVLKQWLEAMK